MAYVEGADYDRAAKVLYYGFVAVMLLIAIYVFLKPRTPDPSNSKAFGCYTTSGAPRIMLNAQGMTVLQSPAMRIGYHLERHKTGIALSADAPIVAQQHGGGYVFSISPPGGGYYLDFFNVINGHSYGVFDENNLRQFTMLATDGTYLPYGRVNANACSN